MQLPIVRTQNDEPAIGFTNNRAPFLRRHFGRVV
jgi:hypothetical protein